MVDPHDGFENEISRMGSSVTALRDALKEIVEIVTALNRLSSDAARQAGLAIVSQRAIVNAVQTLVKVPPYPAETPEPGDVLVDVRKWLDIAEKLVSRGEQLLDRATAEDQRG